MKTVFAFHSNNNSLRHAFTLDEKGKNLPMDNTCNGWVLFKLLVIDERTELIGSSAKEILKGIRERGYYITEDKRHDSGTAGKRPSSKRHNLVIKRR